MEIHKNPSLPTVRCHIKIRAPDSSTKLVETWQNVPGYKLGQFIAEKKCYTLYNFPTH
jgi:hypothetical protein